MATKVNLPLERFRVLPEFQYNAFSAEHAEGWIRQMLADNPEALQHLLYTIHVERIPMSIPGLDPDKVNTILEKPCNPNEVPVLLAVSLTPSELYKLVACMYIQQEQFKADTAEFEEEQDILQRVMEAAIPLLPPEQA
jgi:hypothetical protein